MPLPPGVNGENIEALAGSRQSGVWVVAAGGVVFRVEGPRTTLFNQVSSLKGTPVTSALVDTSGRLWLALSGAQIGMLSGPGQFKVFGPQDGLGPGPHFEIYEDSEALAVDLRRRRTESSERRSLSRRLTSETVSRPAACSG